MTRIYYIQHIISTVFREIRFHFVLAIFYVLPAYGGYRILMKRIKYTLRPFTWSGQDLNLRPTDYESVATNQLSYRTKSTSLRTVTNLRDARFSVRLVAPIQIPNLQLFFGTMNIQSKIFLPYSVSNRWIVFNLVARGGIEPPF